MSVSPGVVDGIQACNEFGPEGIDINGPESEEVGLNGELQLAPGHCPDASVVGTAEAITPFLPTPVKGHVYLAKPGCGGAGAGPCTERGRARRQPLQAVPGTGRHGEFAEYGIEFKVPWKRRGEPRYRPVDGGSWKRPQAPFSELKIHLNGGPRAPIDNPAACGPAVTTTDFTPWSAPGSRRKACLSPGTPDATLLVL